MLTARVRCRPGTSFAKSRTRCELGRGNFVSKAFSHLKGAEAQLIRWAFPLADAAGLRCHVDASKLGHPLYRTCGFEDVGEMTLDLDEYEGGGGRSGCAEVGCYGQRAPESVMSA